MVCPLRAGEFGLTLIWTRNEQCVCLLLAIEVCWFPLSWLKCMEGRKLIMNQSFINARLWVTETTMHMWFKNLQVTTRSRRIKNAYLNLSFETRCYYDLSKIRIELNIGCFFGTYRLYLKLFRSQKSCTYVLVSNCTR